MGMLRRTTFVICLVIAILAFPIPNGLAEEVGIGAETVEVHVIAVVLGDTIMSDQKPRLNGLIGRALFEKYAKDHKIEPTDDEIGAFVAKSEEMETRHTAEWVKESEALRQELLSASMSDDGRKTKESKLRLLENILQRNREDSERMKGKEDVVRASRRKTAVRFIRAWKINRSLYATYGGRVVFQQAGVEPVDACREFLKEQERNGAFKIMDKESDRAFWRYYTDDSMHTFYSKEDGEKYMNTPWWETDKVPKNR